MGAYGILAKIPVRVVCVFSPLLNVTIKKPYCFLDVRYTWQYTIRHYLNNDFSLCIFVVLVCYKSCSDAPRPAIKRALSVINSFACNGLSNATLLLLHFPVLYI